MQETANIENYGCVQVCFHPDGRLIAAGSQSGNVNLFSATAAGDKPEAVFSHHTKFIMAVAYSPDGR